MQAISDAASPSSVYRTNRFLMRNLNRQLIVMLATRLACASGEKVHSPALGSGAQPCLLRPGLVVLYVCTDSAVCLTRRHLIGPHKSAPGTRYLVLSSRGSACENLSAKLQKIRSGVRLSNAEPQAAGDAASCLGKTAIQGVRVMAQASS